jgi:hypothetical protein
VVKHREINGRINRDLTGGQNTGSFVLVGFYKKNPVWTKSPHIVLARQCHLLSSLRTTVRLPIQSPLCFAAF